MQTLRLIIISLFLCLSVNTVHGEEQEFSIDQLEQLLNEEEQGFPLSDEEGENDNEPTNKNIAPAKPADTNSETEAGKDYDEKKDNYVDRLVLRGLNKITARTSELKAPVGSIIKFGKLDIHVKLCWKSNEGDAPDSKALIEIHEKKIGEAREKIFYGWMIASSPALSALEHPVYDVTLVECK
jgi:hypothetical protein